MRSVRRRTAQRIAVAALVAVGAAIATLQYSDANGAWQRAVRDETKRSNLIQEQIRALYADEAPIAFRIATAQARADALGRIDFGVPQIATERAVAERAVAGARAAALPGSLGAGSTYADRKGGFDVLRRAADVLGGTVLPDPERTFADGDAHAAVGRAASLGTVALTGLALVVWTLPARLRRSRRRPAAAGPGADPGASTEELPVPPRQRRWVGAALLLIWALGIVLPFFQLVLGGEEQRSQALAARTAVRVTSQIAVGLSRTGFGTVALQEAELARRVALARSAAAPASAGGAFTELLLGRAELAAAQRTALVAGGMARAPTDRDGLGPDVTRALAAEPADWQAGLVDQQAAADRAGVFGGWASVAVFGIAVVAAAAGVVDAVGRRD